MIRTPPYIDWIDPSSRSSLSTRNIREALTALTARGSSAIRFIADVKWGFPGFPMREDALWVESPVNEMLLDTHPHVVIGDQLKENPGYLAPAEYMRQLLRQLRSSGSST